MNVIKCMTVTLQETEYPAGQSLGASESREQVRSIIRNRCRVTAPGSGGGVAGIKVDYITSWQRGVESERQVRRLE